MLLLLAVVLCGCGASGYGLPAASTAADPMYPADEPQRAQSEAMDYRESTTVEEMDGGGDYADQDGAPMADEPMSGGLLGPAARPGPERRLAQNVPAKRGERSGGPGGGEATGVGGSKPPARRPDVPKPKPGTEPVDPAAQKLAGPLLIYNATITMAVFEATKSIDATQKLAKDLGGYLVRRDDRSITIRVPAKGFRKALDAVGKLGDVLHREESAQDVTDEFYDLQVRLKNAHAMRARLEELLKQAKNVEEALMVERELGRVTEQIERFEGRLKLLRELIAFSTITVEFKPRPTDQIDSNVRLPFYWLNQLGLSQLLSL